jgi:hypothetical protein
MGGKRKLCVVVRVQDQTPRGTRNGGHEAHLLCSGMTDVVKREG